MLSVKIVNPVIMVTLSECLAGGLENPSQLFFKRASQIWIALCLILMHVSAFFYLDIFGKFQGKGFFCGIILSIFLPFELSRKLVYNMCFVHQGEDDEW